MVKVLQNRGKQHGRLVLHKNEKRGYFGSGRNHEKNRVSAKFE